MPLILKLLDDYHNWIRIFFFFLLPSGNYFLANMKVVVNGEKLIHYHIALLVLEVVLHTLGSRHINLLVRWCCRCKNFTRAQRDTGQVLESYIYLGVAK